jgi:hypothetical protein
VASFNWSGVTVDQPKNTRRILRPTVSPTTGQRGSQRVIRNNKPETSSAKCPQLQPQRRNALRAGMEAVTKDGLSIGTREAQRKASATDSMWTKLLRLLVSASISEIVEAAPSGGNEGLLRSAHDTAKERWRRRRDDSVYTSRKICLHGACETKRRKPQTKKRRRHNHISISKAAACPSPLPTHSWSTSPTPVLPPAIEEDVDVDAC